jgi:hypothetical protein
MDKKFNDPWTSLLKTGEIFLFPVEYFNEHLDKNLAYINIECRSLIGYWPHHKIAVIVFNESDKTMLTLLGSNAIKSKKNNLQFVREIHGRTCEKKELVQWGCGKFTPNHKIFAELTKPVNYKLCLPRYGQTAKFYSIRKSKICLEDIHDLRFMPYWRSELSDIYEYENIDKVVERHWRTLV